MRAKSMHRNRTKVVFFFTSLLLVTWLVNKRVTTSEKLVTMSNTDIESFVDEMVENRFGSLAQALELSKNNYSVERWIKLYD